MNVEIGTEAAQFPEKEYVNGIFVVVYILSPCWSVIFLVSLSETSSLCLYILLTDATHVSFISFFPAGR